METATPMVPHTKRPPITPSSSPRILRSIGTTATTAQGLLNTSRVLPSGYIKRLVLTIIIVADRTIPSSYRSLEVTICDEDTSKPSLRLEAL